MPGRVHPSKRKRERRNLNENGKNPAPAKKPIIAFHPAASIFPIMSGEEYEGLVADIHRYGLREPISILNGQVIDGRNRYRACREAGVEPRFKELNRQDSPLNFVLSMNLHRRHLNESQRALVGAKLKPFFEEEARQRKVSGKRADLGANLHQGRSSESAANLVNVSPRSIATATAVLKAGASELVGLVDKGELPVHTAGFLARLHKSEQRETISQGPRAVTFAAKRIEKQLKEKRGEENFSKFHKKVKPLKELGRYSVILADPPWPYEYAESCSRDPQSKYPARSLTDIGNLEVPQICTDDAILFLWSPIPKVMDAGEVVKAWGFDYRTGFVWDKKSKGMGYYIRQQHEFLLIARRGNPPVPLPKNRPPSGIYAPREAHSKKPEEAYQAIEKMYPGLPKIELFARKRRDGWEAWGNEV